MDRWEVHDIARDVFRQELRRSGLEHRIAELDGQIGELQQDVRTLSGKIADLAAQQDQLRQRLADMEGDQR